MTHKYFYDCPCGAVIADSNYCSACDKYLLFGDCGRKVRVIEATEHTCDSRCTNALGHTCNCSCNGKNNGRDAQLSLAA